ncbi:hypothetical protein HN51_004685 [Arachis hypogaea]|uniref:Rab-GAP TBC domain-containing protein n=1 Tax=Arachis hypogaea TaxID=3818 RepID=A0A445DHQ3_ARAHY|nr:TBC1 domain family member 5 [Arachis hypogaea]RYR62642.1 hypothetical protein Ahy_A04g020345 isoform A [Arachis hypogaea]RYR62643.1 hypothetical protein Ahy_A04g020345 isoform B [Arachis hypogaea]
MPPALMNPLMPPPPPPSVSVSAPPELEGFDDVSGRSVTQNRRFGDLRGLQWRVDLGVLPSESSTSIDDLRRVTANCRRRYANLRRRLLVEPHIPKDGSNSPDLTMDNPLSQNPDSTWSRFFRNAELERMVDQDLSRLYPEHGNYFQTPGCQGILRRILLLWCLRHPECGYRQGMHELLAPLLYVLQVDVERLSEVRKLYEDIFTDKFDGLLYQENDLSYSFDFRKSQDLLEDEIGSHGNAKVKSLDELDPALQTIVLLSDAYGAEGELGIVLSEKFMEHDAYCMFDALMSGVRGSVAMADFFSSFPVAGSQTGLPPVIEASTALYHLLCLVDSSLYSHLLDLGVEPQYFSLRWLRVLFGREFSLDNLLIIWDEIFASDNSKVEKSVDDNIDWGLRILHSPRGAFIAAMAVAMLLHLRSSLLATENPTTCLQRLLNFPENINIKKLLEKAKSLQARALSVDISSPSPLIIGYHLQSKSVMTRSQTLPSETVSPKTPVNLLTDSYWEEKWRVAHEAEELKQDGIEQQIPTRKKGWTEKVKNTLRRAGSDPPPSRIKNGKKESKVVRRNILEALHKALGPEEEAEQMDCHEILCKQENLSEAAEGVQQNDNSKGDNSYSSDDRCPSGNTGIEESSSVYSDSTSPPNEANDHEITSQGSSVASNLYLDECDETADTSLSDPPLPVSDHPESIPETSESTDVDVDKSENIPQMSGCNNNDPGNSATHPKEKKQNKFQWFWKFGRNTVEGISGKVGAASEPTKSTSSCSNQSNSQPPVSSTTSEHFTSVSSKGDSVDQNVMGTLKNIGQSMLDHIQVIESVFQQDRNQGVSVENLSKNILVGKGQVTAMAALKELRKISNILSEM